jgi:hypothetical protein
MLLIVLLPLLLLLPVAALPSVASYAFNASTILVTPSSTPA